MTIPVPGSRTTAPAGPLIAATTASTPAQLDLTPLGVPIVGPGETGAVALLNPTVQPGKTAARTLLIGMHNDAVPSTELETGLQHGTHGAIGIRVDLVESHTPEEKAHNLQTLLRSLVDKGLVDGDTEIIIDMHGDDMGDVLELSDAKRALTISADKLLRALGRGPDDAASTGCTTFLCCRSKVMHEQVKDYPHAFLFFSGRREFYPDDFQTTMKEQIRFSSTYASPPAADELWRHAALTTGENPTLAGKGKVETLRLLDLPPSAIEARPKQLKNHLHAKLMHGSVNTLAELVNRHGKGILTAQGKTPLHSITSVHARQATDKMLLLFCLRMDVNAMAENRVTPLHTACQRGDAEMVKCLLENGADIDAKDATGHTARGAAEYFGKTAILAVLDSYEKGAHFREYSLIHFAMAMCEHGNAAVVELLLKERRHLLAGYGRNRSTSLATAISSQQPAIAAMLIKAMPDLIDELNDFGMVPLHAACITQDQASIDALLAAGARVNSATNAGMTAVMFSATSEDWDAVESLLKAGADIHHQTTTGDSALHMAATQGNAAIAGRLLGWGIKLELKNNAGDTALDIATRLGNAEMITLLSSSPAAGTQT